MENERQIKTSFPLLSLDEVLDLVWHGLGYIFSTCSG